MSKERFCFNYTLYRSRVLFLPMPCSVITRGWDSFWSVLLLFPSYSRFSLSVSCRHSSQEHVLYMSLLDRGLLVRWFHFIFSFQDAGDLLATLLPHIRKAVADAGISVELVEIVAKEAAAQPRRDKDLDKILRRMSLSSLLACIAPREGGFRIPLRDKVEQILARLWWQPAWPSVDDAMRSIGIDFFRLLAGFWVVSGWNCGEPKVTWWDLKVVYTGCTVLKVFRVESQMCRTVVFYGLESPMCERWKMNQNELRRLSRQEQCQFFAPPWQPNFVIGWLQEHYSVLNSTTPYYTVLYSVLLHCTTQYYSPYYKVLHTTTKYYTVLLGTSPYYKVLHRTNLYYKVLHSTTRYYSVLYKVLFRTTQYYTLCTTRYYSYYSVPLRTTKYCAVLLCTTK